MSAKNMIVSFVIIGLFVFAMISFGIGIANLNNAEVSIVDDVRINRTFGSLQDELGQVDEQAQSQREKFESESPTLSFGEILFESIVGVGRTFTSTMVGFMNVTLGLVFDTVFGGDPAFAIVFGVFIFIVLITIIFLMWRVFKAGE